MRIITNLYSNKAATHDEISVDGKKESYNHAA